MPSRGQSVILQYTAWNTTTNAGQTLDASNHTLRWTKDGSTSAPTNSPTEVDATNAPGEYKITLTAAECTCDLGKLAGKSATATVSIIPIAVTFEQLPTVAPAASGGLPTVGTSTGQINPTGGKVPATLAAGDVSGNIPADFQTIKTFAVNASGAVTFAPGQVGTSNYAGGAVASVIAPVFLDSTEHTAITGDVLSATATSYNVAGTIGNKINAAGSAGDPWTTVLPGAYGAGTAGNIIGNNLNATVSSRSTYAGGAVTLTLGEHTAITGDILSAAAASYNVAGTIGSKINAAASAGDPWATALPGAYGAGTAGNIVGNRIDAAVSSRSTYSGADTAGTTTLLTRIGGTITIAAGKVAATVASGDDADAASIKTTIGVAGVGLTNLGDTRMARLDVAVSTRSTYAGGDTAGTTTLLTRIPSNLTITAGAVTVGTNNDKTGYAITGAEHTAIGADVQAGLTAQGYTSVRGSKLDSLDVAVSTRSVYAGADTAGTTASLALLKDFLALSPTGAIVSASSANTVRVSVNIPVGLTMPTAADFPRMEVRLLSGADWLSTAKISSAANVAGNQVDLSLSPGFSVAPLAGAMVCSSEGLTMPMPVLMRIIRRRDDGSVINYLPGPDASFALIVEDSSYPDPTEAEIMAESADPLAAAISNEMTLPDPFEALCRRG